MAARKKNSSTSGDDGLPQVSVSDDGVARYLHLGTPWVQGSMKLKEPFEIDLEYVQRMMAWLLFVDPDSVAERRAVQQQAQAEQSQTADNAARTALSPQGPTFVTDRSQALSTAARVPIQSGTLKGSLSLQGGRIDDLFLTDYREVQDKPQPVELFRPQGMQNAYFAQFGWTGPNVAGGVPGPNTPWSLTAGSTLTPTSPVTLTWDNGQGLVFHQKMAIDENYMFTVTQSVENNTGAEVRLAPYGIVARHGLPADLQNFFILHEGAVGMTDGELVEVKYKDMAKFDAAGNEGPAEITTTPPTTEDAAPGNAVTTTTTTTPPTSEVPETTDTGATTASPWFTIPSLP